MNEFCIAVVGARRCSDIGREYAQNICLGLAKHNINLVSGFAYGIDTVAHVSSVKQEQKTVAVLGGGFNHIYPKENERLIKPILENGGAIISEYDVDEPPLARRFPDRNRIIAALADGIIVIEAGKMLLRADRGTVQRRQFSDLASY